MEKEEESGEERVKLRKLERMNDTPNTKIPAAVGCQTKIDV